MYAGEAHPHQRISAVMMGDVERLRIFAHQKVATARIDLQDQRIAVLAHPVPIVARGVGSVLRTVRASVGSSIFLAGRFGFKTRGGVSNGPIRGDFRKLLT